MIRMAPETLREMMMSMDLTSINADMLRSMTELLPSAEVREALEKTYREVPEMPPVSLTHRRPFAC